MTRINCESLKTLDLNGQSIRSLICSSHFLFFHLRHFTRSRGPCRPLQEYGRRVEAERKLAKNANAAEDARRLRSVVAVAHRLSS